MELKIDNKATAGVDPEPPEGEAPPVYLAIHRDTGRVSAFIRGADCDECGGPCHYSKAHMYDHVLKEDFRVYTLAGLDPDSPVNLAATAAARLLSEQESRNMAARELFRL